MLGVIMLFPDLMNGQISWATKDPRAILFNIEPKFVIANLVASQIQTDFADIKTPARCIFEWLQPTIYQSSHPWS